MLKDFFAYLLREAEAVSDAELAIKNNKLESRQSGDTLLRHLTKEERQIAALCEREMNKLHVLEEEHRKYHHSNDDVTSECEDHARRCHKLETKIEFLANMMWFLISESFGGPNPQPSSLAIRRFGLLVIPDETEQNLTSKIEGMVYDHFSKILKEKATIH